MNFIRAVLLFFALSIPLTHSNASTDMRIQNVTQNVYAIVGELGNRSKENLGNNATFGFVVTKKGVVLIDSGGTYMGAQKINQLIQSVTDKPVVKVINTGGQDHRWLGNDFFKMQGAEIISSEITVADQKKRTPEQFNRLALLIGDELVNNTEAVYAETVFEDKYEFTLGDVGFEIHHVGQAHTPGDSFVWLPGLKVMFTGDIVYVDRMLGVGSMSNSKSWVEVFEAMAAFQPDYVVPGHGQVSDLARATQDTYNYLTYLRESVSAFMDDGGDISDIASVDLSRFNYLENFNIISGKNTQQVYSEMEWE